MKIEFYRTIFCPRCLFVSRALKKQQACVPDLEVESIEVATNLDRAWQAGIRSVPALKIGGDTLTGVFITPSMIQKFIAEHLK